MEYISVQGVEVPALGLGTYRLRGRDCRQIVETALELGYRHIDTAQMYNNHSAVGTALRESPVDRDEVFLTTKIWRTNLAYDDVLRSVNESLQDLGLDTVDLLLIHWPSRSVPVSETLEAMNRLQKAGKARHLGVSNFDVEQLKEAIDQSGAPIIADQVRFHPQVNRDDLLAACREAQVMVTAYSPLAKGRLADDATLGQVGDRYGKTAAQVALRWLLQHEGVSAIPKASSRAHLAANIDLFDFALTDEEMELIASSS